MANSSSAGHPDWIAQASAGAQAGISARVAAPGWMAALGLGEIGRAGRFCDGSPFDPGDKEAERPGLDPAPAQAEEAEDDGYMRGFAEGHEEARRAGELALAAEQARLRALRMAFRQLDAAALDALARDLSATVLALCEAVLHDYAIDAQALDQRCRAAAQRLGAGPREVTLHLEPETLARIDRAAFAGWSFEPDPSMAPGALRLTSGGRAVRDGPDDWRRAIAEALGA